MECLTTLEHFGALCGTLEQFGALCGTLGQCYYCVTHANEDAGGKRSTVGGGNGQLASKHDFKQCMK